MADAEFIHLRVHSAYSLSEGAIKLPELVSLCQANAMPAVAITDTSNMFGALEFSLACAEAGIQPIVGCQFALLWDDQAGVGANAQRHDTLVLLAQDETGYRNLVKLSSKAFLETGAGERPHLGPGQLRAHSEGLIALSGGPVGTIGRLILDGQDEAAEAAARWFAETYPGRFYVEISRHGTNDERRTEAPLIELAYAQDLPLVATNECFFPDADKYEAHDALLCVADGTYVGESERRRLTPDHRFKSAAEMRAVFADLPEAVENTVLIAKRCAFMVTEQDPILPPFATESGRSEAEELRAQAAEGLEARLVSHVFTPDMDAAAKEAAAKPYRERLARELDIIEQMGFPGYFLIVSDFIKWAKGQEIPVGPGRGSGAGSVVAWALTITDLDPLRWDLLFERFLNPERISMPDFDIDFCQDRRDEVIRYVQDKYGHDHVAQIITFGKLQARAVLRDVGRVLQMPYGQVDKICRLVPNNPAKPVTLAQAIEGEPELQRQRDQDESVRRLIGIALQLEGLYRHASTHAAGVVIGDRPLDELVPLYRDPRSDMPVTQFNMKYVEQAGLVKFDFLGLKTLTVIQNAVDLLRERGIELDIETLPLDDGATYEMMGRGDTTGVFQLESSGMRQVLKTLRPDRFEDIIAVVALYRPGPMDNIPSYVARKHGKETPDYLHPTLEPILKETFGIMIYQEQVMQIAQTLAGYSLGQADVLRRAMGKKIRSVMEAEREKFVEGAEEQGIAKPKASHIFDLIAKFAEYGFNKSHAAAYALVAYQTGYLKANYPVEFLAASMTLDINHTDKLSGFRQELQRMEIALLPPDINASKATFSVEQTEKGGAIRYALAALKNVGRTAMEALVAEREANGPFKDVADFASRLDTTVINKRQLENLVKAGAFDSLNANRRQVFEAIDQIVRAAAGAARERDDNQQSLFGGDPEHDSVRIAFSPGPDWPVNDRLRNEFEAVGFYMSAHPLDDYRKTFGKLGVIRSADLFSGVERSQSPKLAGMVLSRKERDSAKGNRFAFIQLSDSSGAYEVTAFSEVLAQSRALLDQSEQEGTPVLINATAQYEDEGVRLLANSIEPLDAAVARADDGIRIFVTDPDVLGNLKAILDREKGGRGRCTIVVEYGEAEVELGLDERYAVSPRMRAAIKSLQGVMAVQEL